MEQAGPEAVMEPKVQVDQDLEIIPAFSPQAGASVRMEIRPRM